MSAFETTETIGPQFERPRFIDADLRDIQNVEGGASTAFLEFEGEKSGRHTPPDESSLGHLIRIVRSFF